MGTKIVADEKFWKRPSINWVLGFVLLIVGIILSDIPTMFATLQWPDVPGVITSRRFMGQKIKEYDGDYYVRIDGYLKYRYEVDGTSYSGFAVDALQEISCPEDTARAYPVGEVVTVYYDPKNPSRAVLRPGLVFSGKAFGLTASICCWGGMFFLALGTWRKLTGGRSLLRGWPDGGQSERGIGAGSGRQ